MDRVSNEFYTNVQILTKLVAPHDDFKRHFKEGMFEKPNTLGFIHVSYYLLNIYYKDKLKVQWPVICKQTENKFRNDVRECLMSIASDNADVNFPPIFASHLLLARGTKFLLIMWKFSLVVLRTFLKTKNQCALTDNPKSGPCSDLTKVFLANVAEDNNKAIFAVCHDRENIKKEAVNFLGKNSEKQNLWKAEILNVREKLKQAINDAPVNAAAKKSLSVIGSNKMINMWTESISSTLKSLETEVESLVDEHKYLKSVLNIVSVIKGDLAILNANNLDPINIDPIYQLVPPEMQVLSYNLHSENNLDLQNFFTIFNTLLQKFKSNRDKNEADNFITCKIQLDTSNKDLKTATTQFQSLLEEINRSLIQIMNKKKNEGLNVTQTISSHVLEFDKVLFMSSPSININSTGGASNFNQNYLQLTPVEGAHKQLFSRHILDSENALSAKKPLHVQRINFDDSVTFESSRLDHTTKIDKQSVLLKNRSTFKNLDKYSKIFSSRSIKHDNKANNSFMNMMLPLMAKQHNISLIDTSQEISQNSLLINSNLSSTMDSSRVGDKEKEASKSQKRRSIGDLVERYKKILEERDSK